MSTGNIKTLYADREQTSAVFPRTKIQAISDKNGRGLEAFLDKLPYYGEEEPEDTYTTPIDAETLGGVPAEEYASKQYVKERILEVETGGSVDLSEFATKEDLKAIDYPVDSINGKTGEVTLGAIDVGALPVTGGNITGNLKVGNKVSIYTDTEGGTIRMFPPDGKVTDFWEMDAHDGGFRIFTYRNATHSDGTGYVFPLTLNTDGSISVGNTEKTRSRLGITPANIGAVSTASTSLANISVKTWAESITGMGWAYTNSTTTDMPTELSASDNYAIATVTSVASGGWKELRLYYVVTGCVAVCTYNYGWEDWKWENPPLVAGKEFCTTEHFGSKPVYVKYISTSISMDSNTGMIDLEIPHGISNFNMCTGIYGGIRTGIGNEVISIPCMSGTTKSTSIYKVTSSNIILRMIEEYWNRGLVFIIHYIKT